MVVQGVSERASQPASLPVMSCQLSTTGELTTKRSAERRGALHTGHGRPGVDATARVPSRCVAMQSLQNSCLRAVRPMSVSAQPHRETPGACVWGGGGARATHPQGVTDHAHSKVSKQIGHWRSKQPPPPSALVSRST
jgi:hypothetical protein